MKKHILTALPLIISLFASSLQAEENWYSIEMIVFAHLDDDAEMEEKWPTDVVMSYPKNIKSLIEKITVDSAINPNFDSTVKLDIPDFMAQIESNNTILDSQQSSLKNNAQSTSASLPIENNFEAETPSKPIKNIPINFQLLDKSKYQLAEAMAHLRRIDRYRPLFHKAWMQNLTDRDHSPGILITGGDSYGKHTELEGYIKVSVERYLHVEADLWLHQFLPNFGQAKIMQVPEVPLQKGFEDFGHNLSSQYDEYIKDPYQVSRTVTLRENRRMRSREIHYLDHPLMGVIVVITPL